MEVVTVPNKVYRHTARQRIKHDEALKYWITGMTYKEVAEKMGYSNRSGAFKAVQAALSYRTEEMNENAENGRAIAFSRLWPLWKKALELAEAGDVKAIMAAVQINDRLMKLEGVKEAAQEIRITMQSEVDRDIEKLLAAMGNVADSGVPLDSR